MFYSYTDKSKGWLWTMDSIASDQWLCNTTAAALGITKDTSCVNILIEAGTYIYYPELRQCCIACTGAEGCGPVRPTWFENGTQDGIQEINGELCFRWFEQGNQQNYFWLKVTARSLADAVAYGTSPPLDVVIFDHRHFHFGPVHQSVFDLPPECDGAQTCPGGTSST